MTTPGWKLVPIEPTQEMCVQGQWKAKEWPKFPLRISPIYQAMLAAAPAPPVAIAHEAVTISMDDFVKLFHFIDPPPIEHEGVTRVFKNPLAQDALRMLSDHIRSIKPLATPTASDRPVVRAEQVAAVALNASRYVWLRKTGGRYTAKLGREVDLMADWNTDVMAPDSELDDAIDAAMLLEADRAAPASGDDRG